MCRSFSVQNCKQYVSLRDSRHKLSVTMAVKGTSLLIALTYTNNDILELKIIKYAIFFVFLLAMAQLSTRTLCIQHTLC